MKRTAVLGFAVLAAISCRQPPPKAWGPIDHLGTPPPRDQTLAGVPVHADDYGQFLKWGEAFFKDGGFGNERGVTDVLGVLMGTVQAPCGKDCTEDRAVFDAVVAAIDALDGEKGNLFSGNGNGYTSDLVLEFPKGTTLHGIPVPQRVHTGLDVEAGSPFPIGVVPVQAPKEEEHLPFLIRPSETGMEGAPEGAFRLRMSCAACHYSLDIDQDGVADLHSTEADEPTPGSPWMPHHAWAVGNQDLDFGWLVGLSANPMLAALVIGGDVHRSDRDAAKDWALWVDANFDDKPEVVLNRVVQSILLQPRGWADVTGDARYNTIQIPPLYTQGAWPSNSNGAIFDDTDRNNTVWTGALDFTGQIGLCKERSASLPWEAPGPFHALSCDRLVDLWVRYAPASQDPEYAKRIRADILGDYDGVPGLLDADSLVVMQTTASMPDELWDMPQNEPRKRTPEQYGEQGALRKTSMALLGYRLGVPPDFSSEHDIPQYAQKYPGTYTDDFVSDTVSLFLDWLEPPPNPSEWLEPELVKRGQEVFREAGCEDCHAGPFRTDNVIHWLGPDARRQYGGPRSPSTAGWRVLYRGYGPPIGTEPQRAESARTVRRFASAEYDPATGLAVKKAGPLQGFLGVREIGYKTPPLRGLWSSAPYLHDGGVAVALPPGSAKAEGLAAHLARGETEVWPGAGKLTEHNIDDADHPVRADAALSLQALVLREERRKVVVANRERTQPIPGTHEKRSLASLGIAGVGHEFWVDDQPGGPDVTALVAFLLALDDCPGDVLGEACEAYGGAK
ncbi:MAG: hypothetical protein H6737_11920 [Alphaproteobacteria bacterium]|nr:hypothetical protein [Alphaproteobacteria bacterium]